MTTTTDNARGDNARGDNAGTSEGGRLSAAASRVRDTATTARSRAGEAYGAARERTATAYGTARESASRATRKTADGIDSNPVGALVGGLAIGALLAAVLPRSRREQELLGDYGRRVTDTAREAARAAREAGTGKLDELGLNKDAAKQKLNELASNAGEAVRTSAGAAAQTLKSGSQPQ
jgi:hypothetical protein